VMSKHIEQLSRGLLDPEDAEAVIGRMLPFLAAGFVAPPAADAPGGKP